MSATRTRLSREESQAQTRERLLAAARVEVIRNGFAGASVRDISEAAGYSQGAFYSNFPDKEAIMLELLRRYMREEVEQLRTIVDGVSGKEALERLETWARSLNAEVDWAMLALELQLHARRSPSFATEYDKVFEAHGSELGRIVAGFYAAQHRKPQLDPRELAAGFMALAHGLALQRRRDNEAPAGRLIMTFLRALVATAEAATRKPASKSSTSRQTP
jgi:AcrR family transcriptional regulator